MGYSAYFAGDIAQAGAKAHEALEIQESLGFTWGASDSLLLLGRIAHVQGNAREATRLYRKSLLLAAEHRDLMQLLERFDVYAMVEHEAGQSLNAAIFLGGGDRLRELLGIAPDAQQQAREDSIVREGRATIGPEKFEDAREAGRRLGVDDLIAIGLDVVITHRTASSLGGLTRRQMEVLCLLAKGWTDQEIADRLFISLRTVNTHVSHLLARLDVGTRRQAAQLARSNDLLRHCPVSTGPADS
jgi:non-specific serine/threonine protein kinase